MPGGDHRADRWSEEEDHILLAYDGIPDALSALTAGGFARSPQAARSRKKILLKRFPPGTPQTTDDIARERVALERELVVLERRREQVRSRLVELRVAQVKDALGDIPIPDDVLEALRAEVTEGT